MIILPSLSVLPLEAMSLNLRIMGARLMNGKLHGTLISLKGSVVSIAVLNRLPWVHRKQSSHVLSDEALWCVFLKLC